MKNSNRAPVAAVAAAALMFCVCITGAVLIAIFAEDSNGVLIAQLFGALAVGLPGVLGVAKAYEVGQRQHAIGEGVNKLRNGEMDAKLRAAVAEVLKPHLIDPTVEDQLVRDRATRVRVEREVDQETKDNAR